MSKVTVKEKTVTLADAKARLRELTELAAAGESALGRSRDQRLGDDRILCRAIHQGPHRSNHF